MLIEPRKWVPHPSSAWVGEHEPNELPCSVPKGAPSRRRLICVATVRKDSVSLKGMLIEPRKWVPHPSSAWVGEHEPNQLPCSVPNRCPIQATSYLCRSSEKRQRLAQRNANRTKKMGAPSKLRLGGRARTQSAPLLGTQQVPHPGDVLFVSLGEKGQRLAQRNANRTKKMGAPSKLRLGGRARTQSAL